jgi:hypothetical protein
LRQQRLPQAEQRSAVARIAFQIPPEHALGFFAAASRQQRGAERFASRIKPVRWLVGVQGVLAAGQMRSMRT